MPFSPARSHLGCRPCSLPWPPHGCSHQGGRESGLLQRHAPVCLEWVVQTLKRSTGSSRNKLSSSVIAGSEVGLRLLQQLWQQLTASRGCVPQAIASSTPHTCSAHLRASKGASDTPPPCTCCTPSHHASRCISVLSRGRCKRISDEFAGALCELVNHSPCS